MWCRVRTWTLTTVVALAANLPLALGQELQDSRPNAPISSPLLTTDTALFASLRRIFRGSKIWQEAVEELRKAGGRVLVVTPADVRMSDMNRRRVAFDPGVLAETMPIVNDDSSVRLVVIAVNIQLLRRSHDLRLSVPRDFEADLDRILVHEVYGHAMPYLVTGNLAGRCADPRPGESVSDSCAIRRENAVRAELGLGHRDEAGLHSLALAFGGR